VQETGGHSAGRAARRPECDPKPVAGSDRPLGLEGCDAHVAAFDRYNIIDAADLDAAVAKRCGSGTVAAQSEPAVAPADSLTSSRSSS